MEILKEYPEEIIDRYLRSLGYDPKHVDRDKRMAFTKTIRFQQFAQRMEGMVGEQSDVSPTLKNQPYTKGIAQSRTHTKDMALKRSVHVNKPQKPVRTESTNARLIKSIFKSIREELYDHEKDNKDGTTYGKKPKYQSSKEENTGDEKHEAAAVLSGGTTLTGQKRDDVEIDPVLKKSKPGSPNSDPRNDK